MRHEEIVQDNKTLRFNASNIAPFLLRLKNKEKGTYEEVLQSCKLVIPYLDDFLLDMERYGQKKKVALSWRAKGIVVSREEGASTFQRLNEKDYLAWLEGYSVGELWSKNVISGGPVYE